MDALAIMFCLNHYLTTRAAAKVSYSPPLQRGGQGGDKTLRRWIPL